MKGKNKFTFHKITFEVFQLIQNKEDRADAYTAQCRYELFGEEPSDHIKKVVGEAAQRYGGDFKWE